MKDRDWKFDIESIGVFEEGIRNFGQKNNLRYNQKEF